MPGRPERAKQIAALEKENAALRAALDMQGATEETWGEFAPQDVRDQMAAAALIASSLRYEYALKRLGLNYELDERGRVPAEAKAMAARIFETPGVQAILASVSEAEVDHNVDWYVRRLNKIAMGDDDKNANSAIQNLAKLGGLNKEKSVNVIDARTQNMFLLGKEPATREALGAGKESIEADDFLTHEPGEAAKIFEVGTEG